MTPDELKEKRERRGTWYAMARKATPAPWAVVDHRAEGTSVRGPNGEAVFQNETWPEDMEVAVHCRNNFGKALELLKRVASYSNENKSLSPYALKAVLNQTIGELEELEGVECSIKKSG